MILIDTPRRVVFRAFQTGSHMVSTLAGEEGTAELVAFAAELGLRVDWLQNKGEPREHFDVFDGVYKRALQRGAKPVSPRDVVAVVQWKRELAKGPVAP